MVEIPLPLQSHFPAFSIPDYLALPRDPHRWLLQDLLPSGGLLNLFGDPKKGKSCAALQLASAIASPSIHEWLGFPIRQHGPVLYIQLDTPPASWAARLEEFITHGLCFDQVFTADRLTAPYPYDLLRPEGATFLTRAIEKTAPCLLILDTLREIHRGDEDKSGHMQIVINQAVHLAQGAAICLVSHTKKPNWDIPQAVTDAAMDQVRGSSYIPGRMDGSLKLTTRGIYIEGRTIEKDHRRLKATPLTTGVLWAVDQQEWEVHLRTVLADPLLTSDHARADALAKLTGDSPETCRSRVRRA